MTELLCSKDCKLVLSGTVKPCMEAVAGRNPTCTENIQGDSAFKGRGTVTASVTMNSRMAHAVEVKADRRKIAEVRNGGQIQTENISGY